MRLINITFLNLPNPHDLSHAVIDEYQIYTRLTDLKALAFRSGREYHHIKYVTNKHKDRNYLIMLKKINPGIKIIYKNTSIEE